MENITETGKCLKVRFSRDNSFVFRETVQASEAVANFAKFVQPLLDAQAQINMLDERERSGGRQKRRLSPIFVSEELPHYIRTMEADLFYYEDSKNIDPPRENKDRIHKDWGAANMKKKQHHGRPQKKRLNASGKQSGKSSLRQRITKGGNLWQHKMKRVNPHPNFLPDLPSYNSDLPSYQRFKYLK